MSDSSRPERSLQRALCVIGAGGSRADLEAGVAGAFELVFARGVVAARRELAAGLPDAAVVACPADPRQTLRTLDLLARRAPLAAVVVVAREATPERIEAAIGAGADAFLVEPLSPGQLAATLATVVRARTMRHADASSLENFRARIEELVDQSPVPMFVKDHEGRYRFANSSFFAYVGMTPEQVIGRRDRELIGPEDAADLEAADRMIIAGGGAYEGERRLNLTGEERIYLSTKFPYRDEDGNVVGVVGMALDITEQKMNEAVRAAAALEQRRLIDQLRQSRAETVDRLTFALLKRDIVSGEHISRMAVIAAHLGQLHGLSDDRVMLLRAAAPMHDVGKIAIADHILLKPGPLTMEERAEMERHARIGFEILDGSSSETLNLGAIIALTHHENWDGSGYPRGLRGIGIPLEGRICAVADVFDALLSDRPYRAAMPREAVREVLVEGRGRFFDPEVVDLLLANFDGCCALREKPGALLPATPPD